MNEIRDLIVGIDFGKEYSQICYYDRKGDEARSLSMKAGGNQYEAPCILCLLLFWGYPQRSSLKQIQKRIFRLLQGEPLLFSSISS